MVCTTAKTTSIHISSVPKLLPDSIDFINTRKIPGTKATVSLLYDEYEAIRLLDYEGMNQDQAAVQMNVSRPTMTRIYEKARKTIAQALVEGKMIVIEGGNVQFEKQWFRCKRCFKLIGGLENHVRCKDCKTFSNEELMPINSEEK